MGRRPPRLPVIRGVQFVHMELKTNSTPILLEDAVRRQGRCGTTTVGWNLQAGSLATQEQTRAGSAILGNAAYPIEPMKCPKLSRYPMDKRKRGERKITLNTILPFTE